MLNIFFNIDYMLIATQLIMSLWIVLGGLLEVLPISSSGHLLLLERIIFFITQRDAFLIPSFFTYFLHIFPAFIIPIFFYNSYSIILWAPLRCTKIVVQLFVAGFITELITVFFYWLLLIKRVIDLPLWGGFFISASLLASLYYVRPSLKKVRYGFFEAMVLGIAQGIALLPGISRFGITYVCARWVGFIPRKAFQVSFLIEWPISAVAFLKGTVDAYKHGFGGELLNHYMLFIIITTVIAYKGLCWIESLIVTGRVMFFAWYLYAVAVITWLIRMNVV